MKSTAFFLRRLNDHILYLTKIKHTLEDKGDFCGTDHHLCKLGGWLYGEGEAQAKEIGDEILQIFKKLIEPHKAFHEESSIAVEAHRNGDVVTQEKAFTEMHKLSNRLVSLLLEMDGEARRVA